MNEPDWAYRTGRSGNLSWDILQTYFAKAAVAIHQNSNILTTVGIAMSKYNSDTCPGAEGNKISNAALQAKVNNPAAKVDFYSTHYYDWMGSMWGVPFYETPLAFGLETSKPAIIGEFPANGTTGNTTTQDYENGYQNGWQGAQAWSSNGVDSQGNFNTLIPATNAFKDNHYDLVFLDPRETQPPTIPTGLTATALSSRQITLSWTASSDNIGVTGYRVYRNGTQIAITTGTTYTNVGLTPNTQYTYRLAAYDAAGNNSAQSIQFIITTQASNIPSPWEFNDVGSPAQTGDASYYNGEFTLTGGALTYSVI